MNKKLYKLMNWADIEEIIYSECDHPQDLLGPHKAGNSTLVQAYFPGASAVSIKWKTSTGSDDITAMEIADDDGFFAVLLPEKNVTEYSYKVNYKESDDQTRCEYCGDPYRHAGIIKKTDVEDFRAGKLFNAEEVFGSHIMEHDGEIGTHFAIWAPNAMRVSIVGDFNSWDGRMYQMKKVFGSVFELFIPGNFENKKYQYEIKLKGDKILKKNDPFATSFADGISIVAEQGDFKWTDKAYFSKKKKDKNFLIFETSYDHFSSNAKQLKKEIGALINSVKDQGYTYVLMTPGALTNTVKRITTNFFEINPNISMKNGLKMIVDALHAEDIGVIFKWMPSGFGRDAAGLECFDGSCLYEHQDPRQGISADKLRCIFQYGRPEVISFLMSAGLHWVKEYHCDGICISGVAKMLYLDYAKKQGEWIPNMYGTNENLEAISFIKEYINEVRKIDKNALIMAEDSSTHSGMTIPQEMNGIGFDFKWNEGFAAEYFDYISHDPIERGNIQNQLTDELVYSYAERFILPLTDDLLLRNKKILDLFPGNEEQRYRSLRLSIAYSYMHPGYKLISETFNTAADKLCAALNRIYISEPALFTTNEDPESFEWLSCLNREGCYVSFARKTDDPEDMLIAIANFAGIEQVVTTGVPYEGKYKEIFNSDAVIYGGTGVVNNQTKRAIDTQADGRAQSITVKLAPLSISVMKFIPYTETELAKVIEERIRRNTPIKKSKSKSSK